MASSLPRLPIFEAIASHDPSSIAVVHSLSGRTFTYGKLLGDVVSACDKLQAIIGNVQLDGQRIAFLVENSYDYVVTLLSIIGRHAIAVPISPSFPVSEVHYILDNSETLILVSSAKFQKKAEDIMSTMKVKPLTGSVEKSLVGCTSSQRVRLEDQEDSSRTALMLYTSGTTSRPKGVALTEPMMTAQSKSLIEAWKYGPRDRLLHVLPLHHIHGTINGLMTPLMAGSTVEFMFPFNAQAVWQRLAAPYLPDRDHNSQMPGKITLLTAVPTIYSRLISSHPDLPSSIGEAARTAISPENMRLAISGSAALPTPLKAAWTELSRGNVLLERYGMTEAGMALSCGLDFRDRVDGSVGWPLPSVQVRLVDTETHEIIELGQELDSNGKEREGEIHLRGPTLFREYWRNKQATNTDFTDEENSTERWFRTGDIATRRVVEGTGMSDQDWARGPMYFIRGRKSVDIIKTGGEKVSALEIERELLSLPQIAEAAVVGVLSEQWGQKVAAVVVLHPEQVHTGRGGKVWGVMDMRRALKDRLANYKIPQEMKVLPDGIPRNSMGKVNKRDLAKEVFGEGSV